MKKQKRMNDTQVRIEAISVLNKTLGPANAHRFLTLLLQDATDYVEVSRKIYEKQTVNEIFERAKKNWRG